MARGIFVIHLLVSLISVFNRTPSKKLINKKITPNVYVIKSALGSEAIDCNRSVMVIKLVIAIARQLMISGRAKTR